MEIRELKKKNIKWTQSCKKKIRHYETTVLKKRKKKHKSHYITRQSILVKLPCSFQEPWNVIVLLLSSNIDQFNAPANRQYYQSLRRAKTKGNVLLKPTSVKKKHENHKS